MAQVLKYSGGGNAPKPIKVGDNYYTATQLKTDLYGDKLDEYIKFRDFNPQQEAEFRKNLDAQVDALISGRLSLQGNTLVDSQGEWKNTGMYAKPRFLGSLNEEQKANNASLDVANYLVRALNSGRIMTYISPQKYTKENSKLFQGFDNYFNSKDWSKSELSDRYTKLAGLFDEEINRLKNNKAYRDSYSYEGWQNVEWDKRADDTINNLTEAARILRDTTKSDSDKQFELAKLGYDISDYLIKEEEKKEEEEKKDGNGNGNGSSNGSGNGGNDNGNQGSSQEVVTNISNGFKPVGPFDFNDPIFNYNGTAYTFGTPEYKALLDNPNNEYSEGVSLQSYVTGLIAKQRKIDRTIAALQNVPEYYKYYSNVTPSFEESSDVRAAYLLRPDVLSPKGSVLRIIDNGGNIQNYIIDADNERLYLTKQDEKTGGYKKDTIKGGERFTTFKDKGIVLNKRTNPSPDLEDPIGTTDEIFRHMKIDKPTPQQYVKQLIEYVNDKSDEINIRGQGKYKGQYLGSINKILSLHKKGEINKNTVTYESKNKTIKIKAGDKTLAITLKTPYDSKKDIHISNVYKIYAYKDGGILKAQAGVKTEKPTNKSTNPTNQKEQPKLTKSLRNKNTLSSTNNAALEATSEEGAFSDADSWRLNLALLDVGSAVTNLIPGLGGVSTAAGVVSSVGTAIADYKDVYDKKMDFWDATKNLGMSLGLDAVSVLPGMKYLKGSKSIKVIANILPRAMGAFWAKGLITDENQRKALLETGTKLSNGDFDQLNTQDFQNIATLIRLTTLGARDANSVRKKAFGSGKKENVVISGKVNGTPVTKTIEGDAAKDALGRRFWGMNPRYKAKATKALTDEANSNPNTRQTDTKGKPIDWTEGDIKGFKIETKPAEVEIDGPKAIFENFLGLENKGFNVPFISDKWIAQRWFPKYHQGMVTKKDVDDMFKPENDKYDEDMANYFTEYSNEEIRNMINDKTYDYHLRSAKRMEKEASLLRGELDASVVDMQDVAEYANKVLQGIRKAGRRPKNSKELIQKAIEKQKQPGQKFSIATFRQDLLDEVNSDLGLAGMGKRLIFNGRDQVEEIEDLQIPLPMDKQGGRLDIGLQLIKAYKSGGYLIPKFWNGGDVNDITYTGKPFLEDVPDYTVFYGIDLDKYFYGKNTPAQNSVNTLYKDHQDLLNNGTTVNGKTYGQAEEAYKKSINTGEFINNIEKYLQTHTWEEFNNAITELRGYRKQINNLNYGQERTGSPEEQKKLQDLIRKFNTGYIEVLGPIGGDTRVDKKQFHLNGGATLERHIALLTSQQFADKRNFKDKDGNEVYLDNAFFLNPGTYLTNPQTEPATSTAGGADSLDTSDGTTKPGQGTSLVDQLNGSVEHISKRLTKNNTRINIPRMLALLEAFTGIKANNDATNELLKIRPISEDPIYRLRFRYGNYPAISSAQLANAKINTLASTPLTSDLGTYLAAKQSAYAKMAPNSLAAAQANYEADLKSRLAIQEAEEANTASQITTANANRNRAINNENYKNWLRSQGISSNANIIKTFLSETRNYMNENDKLMKGLQYEKEAEAAYRNYTNSVQKMQDDLVNLIVNSNAVKRTDDSGNTKTDSQILQEYFLKNPDDKAKFATRRQDLESKYREALRKAMESKKINLGLWDTDVSSYTYKQGGTVNEKIKVQKIKDANAARRQDSKESIKAITKDKEEFGKNYRTMSAGALKLLDRATK